MSPSVPILLAATTLLAQAPRAPEPTPSPGVEALAWMAGAWRTTGPVTFEEHWMAPRGGLMVGMGRTVAKGRAVAFEFLRIETKEGRTAYLASPGGRPATRFELTRATADEAVFENLAHDFPKRIIYRRLPDGGLFARVEGDGTEKEKPLEFRYTRLEH
ncbi:MAG: DUF6265 family protein [Holophagaceae bacterium]